MNKRPRSKETRRKIAESLRAYHAGRNTVALSNADSMGDAVTSVEMRDRMNAYFSQLTPEFIQSVTQPRSDGDLKLWTEFCDFMIDQDPHIRSTVERRSHLVAGLDMRVEPIDQTEEARAAAAFARRKLAEIPEWGKILRRFLNAIYYGNAIGETMFRVDDAGEISIACVEPVEMRRVKIMRIDGRYAPIYFDAASNPINIQSDYPGKFIYHSPGDAIDPARRGLLRSAGWWFFFKRLGARYWMGGAEKFSMPILIGKIPTGTPAHIAEQIAGYLAHLKGNSTGTVPAGVEIEQISPSAAGGSAVWDGLCNFFNKEITKLILGATLHMEQNSSVGSFAQADIHQQALETIIASDAEALAETLRFQLVFPLLEANLSQFGGKMPPLPRLWFNTANKQYQELSEWHIRAVGVESGKGVIRRNDLLAELGYPLLSEEEGGNEFVKFPEAPAPAFTAANDNGGSEGNRPLALKRNGPKASHWMGKIPIK